MGARDCAHSLPDFASELLPWVFFRARRKVFVSHSRTVGFTAVLRRCQAEIPRVRRFGSAGIFARARIRASPRFFMDNSRLSIHDADRQRGAHIFERPRRIQIWRAPTSNRRLRIL
jgi:hypothetical protein